MEPSLIGDLSSFNSHNRKSRNILSLECEFKPLHAWSVREE